MPTPRKHDSNAHRQAAYRKRQEAARKAQQQQQGLPPLPSIPTIPGTRRWTHLLAEARLLVETVRRERESYDDARSEAWHDSDRGADFHQDTEELDAILDAFDALNTL